MITICGLSTSYAKTKIALVIGNNQYKSGELTNPFEEIFDVTLQLKWIFMLVYPENA